MTEQQSTIEELVFPMNIRQNPQMMLGDLRDSSVLYRELFDNSRDELIAGKSCDSIWCKTDGDFHIVADNGRGIPVAVDSSGTKTQLELACASIYSSGKYHSDNVAGGRHGIGMSAVNAVSNKFKIASKITYDNWNKSLDWIKSEVQSYPDLRRIGDGLWLYLEFEKGIKVKESVVNYKYLQQQFDENIPEQISTIVGFTSDDTIVNSNRVKFLDSWYEYTFFVLKEFYNKDINITLNGIKLKSNFNPYKFRIKKHVELVHPDWAEVNKDFDIFLSFEFSNDLSESSESGCVNMITVNRGLHITMASSMITDNLKKRYNIDHGFLTPGLKLDVIFLAKKLGFDSQVKTRLVTVDGLSTDDWSCLDSEIQTIFSENNEEIEAHVRALQELADSYKSISSRDYISQMITINSTLDSNRARSFQPVKLIDASAPEENRAGTELFLCEGSSAMGTIMKVRDSYYHAIMPMRGVAKNTSWINFDGLMDNEEICDIISAIGCGVDHEDCYDLSALRFDKVILACDADDDGYHIDALLLGLFAGHMSFLLRARKVFILESPFYKQDGKFIYRNEIDSLDKSRPFERFKGLGSLRATSPQARQEIIDIFINPDTRHLIEVTEENIERAVMTLGDKYTRRILMESLNLIER